MEAKDKKNLESREKRFIISKVSSVMLIADFSSKTIKAWRQWDDIFRALKEKDCQPKILSSNTILQEWGKNKVFSDKQKTEGIHQRTFPRKIIKEALWTIIKGYSAET